jgi:hypothetical protein
MPMFEKAVVEGMVERNLASNGNRRSRARQGFTETYRWTPATLDRFPSTGAPF